mgnify:CR=1 FL=1
MDVGEEVVVGEVVVGDRIVRDEAASSRAERSPKTLSPFSRTGLKRCGFGGLLSRPAVHAASRDGEDRSSSAVLRNLWREEEEVLVRLSERSDLPFIGAREGGERLRRELKGTREMKRTVSSRRVQRSYSISTTAKTFQLPSDLSYTRSAWQKFRHRLGSFPQPAARRDEAWRGEAGGGGGARVDVPLVLMLIQVGKEPPL